MLLENLEINPSYTINYSYNQYKKTINMASGDTAESYISKEKVKKISFKVGPLDNKDKNYVNAFYMAHLSFIPFVFKNEIQRFSSPIKLEISSDERFYSGNISLTEFIPVLITYNVRIKVPNNPIHNRNVYQRTDAKLAYNTIDASYYTEYSLNLYKTSDLVFPIHFVIVDEKEKQLVSPVSLIYSLKKYTNPLSIYLLLVHGSSLTGKNIIDFLLKTDASIYLNKNFPYDSILIKSNINPKDIVKYYRSIYKQLTEKILYFPFKKVSDNVIIDAFGNDILSSFPF